MWLKDVNEKVTLCPCRSMMQIKWSQLIGNDLLVVIYWGPIKACLKL